MHLPVWKFDVFSAILLVSTQNNPFSNQISSTPSSKVHDLNQYLISENISIFGVAESFLYNDNLPSNLDKDYLWIGKCRKGEKTRGGIGLCVSRDISVLNDNLHGSKDDSFERLWSLVRINNTKTEIGVAYFPNDGVENELIHKVEQVFIDEEGKYDLNSDHVIISIKIMHSKGGSKNKTPKMNYKENYMKWGLQNNTNWEDFQKCLNEEFSRKKFPVNSNDINSMWETWKTNINKAATNAIGMKKKDNNYKHFWDKELDGLI